MSEHLSFDDLRHDPHQFADVLFIRAIVQWEKAHGRKVPWTSGQPNDVTLTINGVEVPFLPTVEGLRLALHGMAADYAGEMVREKAGPLAAKLARLEMGIQAVIDAELKGYTDPDED